MGVRRRAPREQARERHHQPAFSGGIPHQWRRLEHGGVHRRVRMQGGPADGTGERVQSVVSRQAAKKRWPAHGSKDKLQAQLRRAPGAAPHLRVGIRHVRRSGDVAEGSSCPGVVVPCPNALIGVRGKVQNIEEFDTELVCFRKCSTLQSEAQARSCRRFRLRWNLAASTLCRRRVLTAVSSPLRSSVGSWEPGVIEREGKPASTRTRPPMNTPAVAPATFLREPLRFGNSSSP